MVFMAVAGRISIATSVAVMANGGTAEFIPLPKRPFTIMAMMTGGRLIVLLTPFANSFVRMRFYHLKFIYSLMVI